MLLSPVVRTNSTSPGSLMKAATDMAEADVGTQWHNHCFTCTKGEMGKTGCRLCFKAGLCTCTKPVILRSTESTVVQNALAEQNARLVSEDTPASVQPHYIVEEVNYVQVPPKYKMVDPLHTTTNHSVVAWEIARPEVVPCILLEDTQLSPANIKEKFRTCLHPCDEFRSWISFHKWLDDLSDDETLRFYEDMVKQLAVANGRIPAFNVHLKCLTGSHNNVVLLGSMEQAAGAVFYICPYMGKKKLPLAESLTILSHAVQHVLANPSKAEDSGSQERNAKHLLERVLNQMNIKIELSSHQVAASLLQLPTILTSEVYSYQNPSAEIAMSIALRNKNNAVSQFVRDEAQGKFICVDDKSGLASDFDSEETEDEEDDDEDSFISHSEDDDAVLDEMAQGDVGKDADETQSEEEVDLSETKPLPKDQLEGLFKGIGRSRCYEIEKPEEGEPGAVVRKFVPYSLLYNNRGEALKHLSRIEMCATMQLKQKPKGEKTSRGEFDLPPQFDLAARYAFYAKQKQSTPILTSKRPPHPGPQPPAGSKKMQHWRERADKFAEWMLIEYRPEIDYYAASDRGTSNSLQYTWEALEDYKACLREDPDPFPSKFRLLAMDRYVTGLRCPEITKKIFAEYRGRNRDIWKNKPKSEMFPRRAPLTLDTEVVLETGVAPLEGKQLQSRIERST